VALGDCRSRTVHVEFLAANKTLSVSYVDFERALLPSKITVPPDHAMFSSWCVWPLIVWWILRCSKLLLSRSEQRFDLFLRHPVTDAPVIDK
jgi:hypothetical protein